jgi:putative membrane protein
MEVIMRIILYIMLLLIILLGVTFAYLNAAPVAFNYYLGVKTIPLSLLLVCSLGVGLIIGFLIMTISWIKLKNEKRRLTKQLKQAKQELENLRAAPLM